MNEWVGLLYFPTFNPPNLGVLLGSSYLPEIFQCLSLVWTRSVLRLENDTNCMGGFGNQRKHLSQGLVPRNSLTNEFYCLKTVATLGSKGRNGSSACLPSCRWRRLGSGGLLLKRVDWNMVVREILGFSWRRKAPITMESHPWDIVEGLGSKGRMNLWHKWDGVQQLRGRGMKSFVSWRLDVDKGTMEMLGVWIEQRHPEEWGRWIEGWLRGLGGLQPQENTGADKPLFNKYFWILLKKYYQLDTAKVLGIHWRSKELPPASSWNIQFSKQHRHKSYDYV